MIFQDANLLPWRNLRQNIEFPFEIKKRPPDRPRIEALLDETGLTEFGGSMPRELSGGMQQRASIARALVHDPKLVLMDEPFGALDAMTRESLNVELQRIWLERRETILFVTHSIAEAVFLADRVFVMTARPGRLLERIPVGIARPRALDVMATPEFGGIVREIRARFNGKAGA